MRATTLVDTSKFVSVRELQDREENKSDLAIKRDTAVSIGAK